MDRRAALRRLVVPIVVLAGWGVPSLGQGGTLTLPRARAEWSDPALRELAVSCAEICGRALRAYEQAFGVEGPPEVIVVVDGPPATGFPGTCAVPPDRIFVNAAGWEIGQRYRPRAGPVGLLCQAVAELLSLAEIPGFSRYAAHVHGVAAVCRETPPVWQGAPYALDGEGPAMFAALRDNIAFLEQHPNWAAASLLWFLEQRAGGPGEVCRALLQEEGDGHERLMTVAGRSEGTDPEVATAVATYVAARKPLVEAPPVLMISGFDTPDDLARWQRWGAELTLTQEDVAEGQGAAEISYPARPDGFATLCLMDEDWRYADWSSYQSLVAHVHNPMPFRVSLMVEVFDAVDRARCVARCKTTVGAGYTGPWAVPLDRLWVRAVLYEDARVPATCFDARSVSQLCLTIPNPLAAGRVRIDGLQLQREVGGMAE